MDKVLTLLEATSLEEFAAETIQSLDRVSQDLADYYSKDAILRNDLAFLEQEVSQLERGVWAEMRREAGEGEKFADPLSGRSNDAYRTQVAEERLLEDVQYQNLQAQIQEINMQRTELSGWLSGHAARLRALQSMSELLAGLL